MVIHGCVDLENPIPCKGEVLGQTFDTVIAGINVRVSFPRLPEDMSKGIGMRNPLRPPVFVDHWKHGEEWGTLCSSKNILASVERLVLYVECEETNKAQFAQTLYKEISKWEKSFMTYCNLLSREILYSTEEKADNHCRLGLYQNDKRIRTRSETCITLAFFDGDVALTKAQIEDIFVYASSQKELFLEYQMLLEAYQKYSIGDFRQAIMNASAALELCLNRQIKAFCKSHNIASEAFFEKYRFLGAKVQLISQKDASLNIQRIKEEVIDIRNDVAHCKRIHFSSAETKTLIDKVEEVLAFYHASYY